ncbi:trigger factor [Chloroflexota bacterium]
MKVTREKTESCQAYLTVELESAEMDAGLAKAFRHLAREVKIPGFRSGKAPRAVLERYLGQESILDEALKHLLPETYEKAIKEQGIEPFAQPEIEIVQTEPAITYKAIVPLQPEVKLGDYHQISVETQEASVPEESVDAVIEQLRHQHATWEPVERGVEFKDLIVMDLESSVDSEAFVNQKDAQYFVVQNAVAPLQGYPEQLVGMKKDEEKEFTLVIPDDYQKEELAGKTASFKVNVTEIKGEKLPEVNDEFVKQINPEFTGVSAMREQIVKTMTEREEVRVKQDFENRAVEVAVAQAEIEYPAILVESEISQLIEEQSRRLQMDEKALDQYLQNVNKTHEQLREEMRPAAVKRVSGSLVLGKVADEEKFEIAGEEIDAEIEKMTQNVPKEDGDRLRDVLNQEQSRESIQQVLLARRTVAKLADIARGNYQAKGKAKGKKKEAKK